MAGSVNTGDAAAVSNAGARCTLRRRDGTAYGVGARAVQFRGHGAAAEAHGCSDFSDVF